MPQKRPLPLLGKIFLDAGRSFWGARCPCVLTAPPWQPSLLLSENWACSRPRLFGGKAGLRVNDYGEGWAWKRKDRQADRVEQRHKEKWQRTYDTIEMIWGRESAVSLSRENSVSQLDVWATQKGFSQFSNIQGFGKKQVHIMSCNQCLINVCMNFFFCLSIR